jgi:hypothetical protein
LSLQHIRRLQSTDICNSSDGKTPDEIVKQVLAIAPVLPGQKAQAPAQPQAQAQSQPQVQAQPQLQEQPRHEMAVPAAAPQPQQFQQPQQSQTQQTQPSHQPQQFQPYQPTSNLVDFGHAGGVAPQQPVQQQQHTSPLNTIGDLKEPLQPIIHRQDSVEGIDETFHDADS